MSSSVDANVGGSHPNTSRVQKQASGSLELCVPEGLVL